MENKNKKHKNNNIKKDVKDNKVHDTDNVKVNDADNNTDNSKVNSEHDDNKNLCDENIEKIKKLEDELLRSQAELINYKRRKDEETSRIIKYAEEDILKGLLPILDNFERAINMDDDNLEDEVSKFLEGFKIIYKQFKDLLERFEVKEIDCLNKPFDPTYQQAIAVEEKDGCESGIVTEVLQKGYMYKDRVLRAAMVKVSE